uniref:Uncharacterized protein n=1 Tax=viral metagenome TaxID=1070528 RepID=A0A6H2A3M1_9ZZZZ
MKKVKKVYHEIEVPEGKYCWNTKENIMCEQMNPRFSQGECLLEFFPTFEIKVGWLKPNKCLNLKTVGE